MFPFGVVFTKYFITRNEISFLSNRPQRNNTRNENHFSVICVKSYKDWPGIKLKKIHYTWNEISCKHPLKGMNCMKCD